MRLRVAFAFGSLLVSLVACTVTSSDGGGSSSGSSGGASSSSGGASSSSSGGASSSSGGSTSGGNPAASTTEANVEVNAACPAVAACGGALSGTYDYTGGCVGDVFADARKQCPGLDTKGVSVKVQGSLHFTGTNALTRDAIAKLSGHVIVPAQCSLGQCAQVESSLKPSFDSVSCAAGAGGSCDCTIAKTDTTKNATTYTTSGTTLKTADGDTYEYCASATGLTYKGKSAGAEEGNWSLKKR